MEIAPLVIVAIKLFVVFNIIMGLASVCTWVERKGSALIQDRIGANRAGAYFYSDNFFLNLLLAPVRVLGMLGVINTLLCDAVKALTKEDFVPKGVSNFVHCLGPFMAVFPIFVAFAIVPLGPDLSIAGYTIRPQLAPLNAGILFMLAMGSLAVYGVAIAGWTGNNKFSMLGGLRAAAQMISYELAMGIAVVTAIVIYGTLDLYEMVERQTVWWGFITMPLGFVILFVCGMAETKRGPFDLPESESELAAGYFTEYSGMKFLLFWLGEFAEIGLFSLLLVIFFFGGWHPLPYFLSLQNFTELIHLSSAAAWIAAKTALPASDIASLLTFLIGHAILLSKVMFFCVLQIVIRWTLPRFRYDKLMSLGWKVLLPLSMVNLMATAAIVLWMRT